MSAGVRLKHLTAEHGMEQDFGAWQTMRDQSSSGEPAHSGHIKVKNHDVGLAGLGLREHLGAITRALAPVIRVGPLQKFAEATADCLVVINDEDFHRTRPLWLRYCSEESSSDRDLGIIAPDTGPVGVLSAMEIFHQLSGDES